MLGQKCSKCGYHMDFIESVVTNIAKTIFDSLKESKRHLVGINTVSNVNDLRCPNCGAVGRWVREDQ